MAIDHKMILFAGLRWVMGLSLVLEVLDVAWAHCGESYVILLISCIHGSHGISFSVSVPIQLSFAIHLSWLLFITYSSVSVLFDSCCHEAVYFLDRVCQCSGSIGRQTGQSCVNVVMGNVSTVWYCLSPGALRACLLHLM